LQFSDLSIKKNKRYSVIHGSKHKNNVYIPNSLDIKFLVKEDWNI
jgi:hypothetical protein